MRRLLSCIVMPILCGALISGCATPGPVTDATVKAKPKKLLVDKDLEIAEIQPASPAVLGLGEKLTIDVAYRLKEEMPAVLLVRPYTEGRQSPGYIAHAPIQIEPGTGRASGWFMFNQDMHVDEIRVSIVNRLEKRLVMTCTNRVDAVWAPAPASE